MSGTRELRRAHRCDLGWTDQHGVIVECEGCGRIWVAYVPGNPNYSSWRRRPRWWAHLRGWLRCA